MKLPETARFSTVCIHAGQEPDPSTGAIITPIFQTSTYVQEELGRHKGFEYARTQNPTRPRSSATSRPSKAAAGAYAFASGMAAIGAIATMLKSGDHVVVTDNTYGGTFRLFDKVLTRYGLTFSYVDTSTLELVEEAMRPETRMVFIETPTNPVMRLTDIAAAADAGARARREARRRQHLCEPVPAAADRARRRHGRPQHDEVPQRPQRQRRRHRRRRHDEDLEWLKFIQNAEGAILSPFDSWLVLRGTKTLALRMAQHNINGLALAEYLAAHPAVKQVLYPGLPAHPQHELAKRQMRGFGGMLSFDVGTFENARRVCNRVQADVACREPGRRRDADLPPRVDDARVGAARAPRRHRPDRQPGPHLGWHRGSAGFDRRISAGARETLNGDAELLNAESNEFRSAD